MLIKMNILQKIILCGIPCISKNGVGDKEDTETDAEEKSEEETDSTSEEDTDLKFICADEIAEDGTASLAFTYTLHYIIEIDRSAKESCTRKKKL